LGVKNLLFKYINKKKFWTVVSLNILLWVILSIAPFVTEYKWIGLLSFIQPFLIILIINHNYKEVLSRRYRIQSNKFMWNADNKFSKMKKNSFVAYLIKRNLYKKEKIEYLINAIEGAMNDSSKKKLNQLGYGFCIYSSFVDSAYNLDIPKKHY
jgi:hypothetical protein